MGCFSSSFESGSPEARARQRVGLLFLGSYTVGDY